MIPHIISSQIDEAEANAVGMRDAAASCPPEQPAVRARFLSGAHALENMCNLARQLAFAAITNGNTVREMQR